MAKVKLFAPVGTSSCSFAGDEFKVAEDGSVEVPDAAIETLASHGFVTSRDAVGKPVITATPEALAELAAKLTAVTAERDDLKVQLEAAKKRK